MTVLGFVVNGPPAPQGSKRHVGRGIMVESSEKVKPWRQDVRFAAEAAMEAIGWVTLAEPVALYIDFYLRKPKKPRFPLWPASKPDLDKLARATIDALDSANVFIDDSLIVRMDVSKEWAETGSPGAVIQVAAMTSTVPA